MNFKMLAQERLDDCCVRAGGGKASECGLSAICCIAGALINSIPISIWAPPKNQEEFLSSVTTKFAVEPVSSPQTRHTLYPTLNLKP